MPSINLYQADSEKDKASKRLSLLNGGFFFSLGIFILVLISMGVVQFMSSDLEVKSDELKNKLVEEKSQFSAGGTDLQRIFDFDSRMKAASNNILIRHNDSGIFSIIEGWLIPEVKAESIVYVTKDGFVQSTMTLKTNRFVDVARQILSFKSSEKFNGVLVEGISREEQEIIFKLKVDFKKDVEKNKQ